MKKFKVFTILLFVLLAISGCTKDDSSGNRPTFVDPNNPSNGGGGNPNGCVAVDTDGDGLRDCEDPDKDNDGYLNENDVFPIDRTEWVDTDSDGFGDNKDWAPADPLEWADFDVDDIGDNADPDDDNDGVPDRWDSFSKFAEEQFDIDFDGLGHNLDDHDIDNDGIPNAMGTYDVQANFHQNPLLDSDGDGITNDLDLDDNNDEFLDSEKPFLPWDDLPGKAGGLDIDYDFVSNESDADIDGDGVINELDAFIYDKHESMDSDSDSIGNNADPDDDNDSVPDPWDDFPLNRDRSFDYDHDGFANEDDRFPDNPNEWADADGDGYGDNGDAFPTNPSEWSDTDLDGVGDNTDPDIDDDGYLNQLPAKDALAVYCFAQVNSLDCRIGNNLDCQWVNSASQITTFAACNSAGFSWNNTSNICEDLSSGGKCAPQKSCAVYTTQPVCNSQNGCSWNGATCDQEDYFPFDENEHLDDDLDALGDGLDPDDDNDGIPDGFDEFQFRIDAFFDFDNDGLFDWTLPRRAIDFTSVIWNNDGYGNFRQFPANQYALKTDPDSDNDGIPDFWDDIIWDPVEWADIDSDGLGNNLDSDDDGDGASDVIDIYPFDASESADTDADDIGNNADPDDDNDGAPDLWDNLSFNRFGFFDLDDDGIPDQQDRDLDGDFFPNGLNPDSDTHPFGITCTSSGGGNFNCLYTTSEDKFEFDSLEWADNDLDTIGDNADPDDDNDGVPDTWDDNSTDDDGYSDIDRDNIPDQIDPDFDGDGELNETDAFPWDQGEIADTDLDDIGNISDPEDDNDGVPDKWDDFPLDPLRWADNDGDGIANDEDIYTPDGINTEADILTAISHGEIIGLTSDVSVTSCINFVENTRMNSPGSIKKLIYNGPNGGCLINLTFGFNGISNVELVVPANKEDVTLVKSTVAIENFGLHQNIIHLYNPKNKILDVVSKGPISITRNNIEHTTNINLSGTGSESLFNLRTSSPTSEQLPGIAFAGNIIFWDITTTQSSSINLFKAHNPIRTITFSNNAIKVTKDSAATIPPPSALINLDFDGSIVVEQSGIQTIENRINMNFGQAVYLVSSNNTLVQERVISQNNKIFGITNLGNSLVDTNPDTNPSYDTYYDFNKNDVWLAHQRGDYAMYYFPNTTKVNNSPALFPESRYNAAARIYTVEEVDLGDGTINYIGVFPPTKDSDADTFRDTIDKFPLDNSEWFDNDNDGSGNTADLDDDNDQAQDIFELSYCANELAEISCTPKVGCEWNQATSSCRKATAVTGCVISGSNWNYTFRCCINESNVCVDGTDPFQSDTDHDGLTDYQEMFTYTTNPLVVDTDNDNDTDAEEISNGTDPKDPLSSKDTDGDGLNDNTERTNLIPLGCLDPHTRSDSDGDGLTDYQEYITYNTNPCVTDTDNDGLIDQEEVVIYNTDPLDNDTDNDGRLDGQEIRDPIAANRSNPLIADTDGDGSNDGNEVTDGTDPNSNTSFKDTDHDLESDYIDKTPFGVVPCDNTSLATCTNAYSDLAIFEEFNLQVSLAVGATGCASKVSQVTCVDPVRDLCKWDSGASKCRSKQINIYQDVIMKDYSATCSANLNSGSCGATAGCQWNGSSCVLKSTATAKCYSVSANGAELKLRSAKVGTLNRKKIVVDNSLTSASGCSFASLNGAFILSANTGIKMDNLKVESGTNINTIVSSLDPLVANRGGYSVTTNNTEFHSTSQNSFTAIRVKNYKTIDINKTTIKATLDSATPNSSPLYSAIDVRYNTGLCSTLSSSALCNTSSNICTWTGSACVDNNSSSLSMKGLLAVCDTKNHMTNMYNTSKVFNCINTEGLATTFDGNVIILDDSIGLSTVEVTDSGNNLRAWSHTQYTGAFTVRNSRFYSKSKTAQVVNNSSTVISSNLRSRNGANSDAIEWTGGSAPTMASLPTEVVYGTVFNSSTEAKLACVTGNSGDAASLHPAYFVNSPLRDFWHLILRTSYDSVQIPGADDRMCQ